MLISQNLPTRSDGSEVTSSEVASEPLSCQAIIWTCLNYPVSVWIYRQRALAELCLSPCPPNRGKVGYPQESLVSPYKLGMHPSHCRALTPLWLSGIFFVQVATTCPT